MPKKAAPPDHVKLHARKIEREDERREMSRHLPDLAHNVFAVRLRPRDGYQWSREKTLGTLIRLLQNYDAPYTEEDHMFAQILFSELQEWLRSI